jgi:hypothetical protein
MDLKPSSIPSAQKFSPVGHISRILPAHLVLSSARISRVLPRAGVAELADAPDLGSGGETREGSSPFARTI